MSIKALAISDIHDGSKFAVANQPCNSLQRFYKRKWLEMVENVGHVDYLLILGDIVEGVSKKEAGKHCWTTDIYKQIEDAEALVNLIKYDRLAVTYSGGYHAGENLNADEVFAKRLNAWKSDYELTLQLTKSRESRIHMCHYISVSTSVWMYRTTPLARELVAALLNESITRSPNIILRGHAHYHCMVCFTNIAMTLPCWKARSPYEAKKGLFMIPKHGYIMLQFNDDGKLVSIQRNLFDMPKFKLVKS